MGWNGTIPGGYGAWTRREEHNNAHFFTNSGIIDKMKDQLKGQVSDEINSIMILLDAVMNLAATSIMMPGGEVMTFSGMDTVCARQVHVGCERRAPDLSNISHGGYSLDSAG